MRCPHCSEKLHAQSVYVKVEGAGMVQIAGFPCARCKTIYDLAGNQVQATTPKKAKDR